MDRNFQRALSLVLKHEGGYVDHPSDPGGATNKGITIGTYRRYVNRNGTKADLRNITDEQVAKVYRKHYWDKVRGDDLPSGVDYCAFDFAVNSGPSRSAKHLQAAVDVVQDGVVGPKTIAAAHVSDAGSVINEVCDSRMDFLKRLSHWSKFGRGWTSRVTDVRAHALQMVDSHVPTPTPRPEVDTGAGSGGDPKPSTGNGAALGIGAAVLAVVTAVASGWETIMNWLGF